MEEVTPELGLKGRAAFPEELWDRHCTQRCSEAHTSVSGVCAGQGPELSHNSTLREKLNGPCKLECYSGGTGELDRVLKKEISKTFPQSGGWVRRRQSGGSCWSSPGEKRGFRQRQDRAMSRRGQCRAHQEVNRQDRQRDDKECWDP